MRTSYRVAAIVGGLLAFAVVLDADVPATHSAPAEQLPAERRAHGNPPPTALRIKNVRLVAAPMSSAQPPSAVLKFDLANEGAQRLTDTLVEIVITERQGVKAETLNPRIIMGPVTIRGTATIEAGYTLEYQMLLRNVSAECECVANVVVLSARTPAF
jgi:hypothetical protein